MGCPHSRQTLKTRGEIWMGIGSLWTEIFVYILSPAKLANLSAKAFSGHWSPIFGTELFFNCHADSWLNMTLYGHKKREKRYHIYWSSSWSSIKRAWNRCIIKCGGASELQPKSPVKLPVIMRVEPPLLQVIKELCKERRLETNFEDEFISRAKHWKSV